MKRKLLFLATLVVSALGLRAQTDVTSTYITNAGFDESGDFQTGNVATGGSNQRKAVTGWTNTGGDTYTTGAAIGFGTSGQINGANLPSTNSDGTATGGALCLNAAWTSQVWYAQEVTLPAGNYTMTFKVNNVGQNAAFEKDPVMFSFTTTDGSSFSGNVHSYPANTWTTQTITFALASETTGTIKIGYKAGNTGSGNTPKLVVDNVKAMYNSNYTATLQSAIDRATILNARASDTDLASAITTAQGVLDAADNSIAYQATINSAVTTLRSAISTAAAKVVLLEGENITFMFENADFESGTPVTVGITTYDYDAATNGTHFSRMQVVEGWTIAENGNAKSAGIYQFGQNPFLGSSGTQYQAPASGSATGEEKALGIVAVWGSSAQYKQAVTFPAGSYIIEVPVFNTAGTTAFSKNLIGFVENGGTEHLATAKTYATGSWITEKVIFELANETAGYLSLGYTAANSGSGAMPHLFIDGVKVTYTSPIAAAYQKYQDALQAAQDAIGNNDYDNVTGDERTALQSAIDATPATTKEGYNNAADDLDAAREAFTGAKANYDAFVAAKATTVPDLTYAATAKKTALTDAIAATASTSTDAATKAAAITTALRAYYESNALAEGVADAVDLTSKLTNAKDQSNTNGWTVNNTTGNCNLRTMSNEPYTYADGTTATGYFDTNSWGSSFASAVTQEVELYAGKYILSVKARGAETTTYQLTANGETVDISAIGNTGGVFGSGWNGYTVEFTLTDKATVALGVNFAGDKWLSFGDFQLVRLELTTEMAATADYDALNAAITTAEAKTLGFDAGEYAPYNNVEVIKAIADAKALDQTADNPKDEVTALTDKLTNDWKANADEVDAIFDGVFATTAANTTSGDINLPGWTKVDGIRLLVKDEATDPGLAYTDGKAAVFSWGGTTLTYGAQTGYTLPLNKNEMYELTLKITGWRDGDFSNVLTVALDGAAQTVNPNIPGKINDAEGNPFVSLKFYLTPTKDNSTLTIYSNHHFAIADLSLKKAVAEAVTIGEDADYTPAETYANITLTRTIKAGTWNTFMVPFDIDNTNLKAAFGDDVAVAEYKEESADAANAEVQFNTMGTPAITANIPVLLKTSTAGTSYTFNGVEVKTGDIKKEGTNFDFVGTYAASTDIAAGDYFISANKLYKSSGTTTIKGTRAYIKARSTGNEIKSLNIFDEEGNATAIDATEIEGLTVGGKVFDLSGREVKTPVRGLYIQNGKKVFIK